MSDLDKWAESTNEQLYEIAKDWAKRFTTPQLRGFQEHYDSAKKRIPSWNLSERNWKGLENMWQCATFAISIREFGQ